MFTDKLFRYAVDRLNGRFISGWCFSRLRTSTPVRLTVAVDGREIVSTLCNRYRKDLKQQSLHPSGLCGFDIDFPDDFDTRQHRLLTIHFNGSKRPARSFDCQSLPVLRPDPEVRIFFMHSPKTAGTSFNAFARCCFPGGEFVTHLERRPPETWRQVVDASRYVAGHLGWRTIRDLVPSDRFRFYAMLRDPYAHLHSHLNYVRCVDTNAEHEQLFGFRHNDTIRDLAVRLNRLDFADARQASRFVEGLSGFELDFFDNIQTRYFLDYRPEKVEMADVDNALANLDRFRLVGLTERYDRFLALVCGDIGLAPQQQDLQSNRADGYRLFDRKQESVRQCFAPLVEADLELYRRVAERFGD